METTPTNPPELYWSLLIDALELEDAEADEVPVGEVEPLEPLEPLTSIAKKQGIRKNTGCSLKRVTHTGTFSLLKLKR